MRVGLTALTMAEYFRDVNKQDVLLFIDNIFRFTQAGSEVSALLGRMPSAVGYQPTLATEMGALQERFLSQPFFVAEIFTGSPGKYVSLEDTIKGFTMILTGELDDLPEQAFYLVGNIDEAIAKAETLK